MALSTAKFSELPFHNPIPLCSRPSLSLLRCRFSLLFSATSSSSSSFRLGVRNYGDSVPRQNPNPNLRSRKYPWDEDYPLRDDQKGSSPVNPRGQGPQRLRPSPSAPWLQRWTPPSSQIVEPPPEKRRKKKKEMEQEQGDAGYLDSSESRTGPIERIVHRLRNLGLGDGEEKGVLDRMEVELDEDVRLGDLLERSWNRPDGLVKNDQAVLPWERGGDNESKGEEEGDGLKRRRMKAPTLAELTIEDLELRRLRRDGMILRERITIPKAGVTQAIVEKIHDVWRKSELARLKFHETLAHDMKTAHELVERRTGGLVTWRSGSVMLVYRGSNYQRPSRSQSLDGKDIPTKVLHDDKQVLHEGDALFVPDVSCPVTLPSVSESNAVPLIPEQIEQSSFMTGHADCMTAEEAEFNQLLDGLGPRFVDWWGTGILPVDADLLPQNIPGYKTPFRLLPTGMRSRLTNAEMTNLRKLARSLPCHFALGRNRNHHGLAAAIVRLWETSLVVKIAVKRGIQNTNNKLMAEELKMLTGGLLLQRNKYYIVIYRGKDFLPTSVATALAERQELTKDIQDVEEQTRNSLARQSHAEDVEGHALAGTLAEFHEAKARWGREVSAEERERMKEEASRYKTARVVKRIEHKLSIAQAKKLRAERLLAKIESSMIPVGPSNDQETITDEERSVFRRIGLRMKAYLPLGIRGVFDGVIENMHLHWKHRELVKLISKQKTLSFVEDTARLLEYESDGILVAIERVPKGYALIYYRGKNYQRPISLRPRNLLTKAKALKRSVSMQRHEALCQHISELERAIEQINLELGDSVDVEGRNRSENVQVDHAPQFNKLEDQDSSFESEDDDSDDFDINDYGD